MWLNFAAIIDKPLLLVEYMIVLELQPEIILLVVLKRRIYKGLGRKIC